jgi:transcription elongation factor GreA
VEIHGSQKTFQILGPRETNPDQGRISFQSPLGAALLDHKVGDSITLKTGNGDREYRIIEIK